MKSVIALLVMVLLVGVVEAAPNSESTKVFYRYKNSQGVTVMDSSIPPEYVNGGYEILSIGGKVLKVVPPALDAKEAEQQRQARLAREERARTDLELRRSYSNVKDIDAAKARTLTTTRIKNLLSRPPCRRPAGRARSRSRRVMPRSRWAGSGTSDSR